MRNLYFVISWLVKCCPLFSRYNILLEYDIFMEELNITFHCWKPDVSFEALSKWNLIFIFLNVDKPLFLFSLFYISIASFLHEEAMLVCAFLLSGDVKHGTYPVFIVLFLLCRGWPLSWRCINILEKLDVPLLPSYMLVTYLFVQVLSRDTLIMRYFKVLMNWCHLAHIRLITNTLVCLMFLLFSCWLKASGSRDKGTLESFTKNLCIEIIRHGL